MIKKLNIVLLVIAAVLFGIKGLQVLLATRAASAATESRSLNAAGPVVSSLSPRILYCYWPPYAAENPVSNHNGYILDIVRAIFPCARFDRRETPLAERVAVLHQDRNAVLVSYGHHPLLRSFPQSKSSTGYYELAVFTARTNAWHYTGPASLDQIRLGCSPEYFECAELTNHHFVAISEEDDFAAHLADVQKGRFDGFIETHSVYQWDLETSSVAVRAELRMSEPIGRVNMLFTASDKDPAFSKKLLDDFEAGLARITASGELARIKQYYSFE